MNYIKQFQELIRAYEFEFKKWFRDGSRRNKAAGVRLRKIVGQMQKIAPQVKKQMLEEEKNVSGEFCQ